MNKIFTVFKFELKNAVKSSAFIISTSILVFMIIAGSIFFRVTSGSMEDKIGDLENQVTGAVISGEHIGILLENSSTKIDEIKSIYKDDKITEYKSEDEIKTALENNEIIAGVIIRSLNDIKVITNKSMMFSSPEIYTNPIRSYLVDQKLSKKGITSAEITEIQNSVDLKVEQESLNPISPFSYTLATLLTFIIYLMVIMNGTISATSVAREKSDRTMELLITSTEPTNLINGKVIASFVQGLLTLISYGIAGFVGFMINKDVLNTMFASMDLSFDPMIIVIFIAFFIFGYILYLYVYAALGATVSKIEEVNVAVTPVMLIVIVVYFTTIMAYTNPEGTMMKVLSFVPFSSPFTMHARYALTDMPLNEVWISLGILFVTTVVLSILSIRLYRSSSLNYGKHNKFLNRLNKIFRRKNK